MSELLESKWQDTKVALLEGLTGNKKSVMSATLENTRKYCKISGKGVNEGEEEGREKVNTKSNRNMINNVK